MSLSITLQPLRLIHEHNVVTQSIGVIFVNTHLRGSIGDHTKLAGKPWGELRMGICHGEVDTDELWEQMTNDERGMFNELVTESHNIGWDTAVQIDKR